MTRSLRHRLARRGRSPYIWLAIPVISPYTDRLQRAAFPGGCVYLVIDDDPRLPCGGIEPCESCLQVGGCAVEADQELIRRAGGTS